MLYSYHPSATATAVITPTATITQAAALVAPSPIPPASFPPTATENPLAGAPDGATGRDALGNWTKVENGVTYTWTTITDSLGQERYRGWVGSHVLDSSDNINGGIPPQDPDEGYPSDIPFYFLAQIMCLKILILLEWIVFVWRQMS